MAQHQSFCLLFRKVELCGKIGKAYVFCVIHREKVVYEKSVVGNPLRAEAAFGKKVTADYRDVCRYFCIIAVLFAGFYLVKKAFEKLRRQGQTLKIVVFALNKKCRVDKPLGVSLKNVKLVFGDKKNTAALNVDALSVISEANIPFCNNVYFGIVVLVQILGRHGR